jgi:hypothetical protein
MIYGLVHTRAHDPVLLALVDMAERGDETGNSRKKVNKSEQGMDSSGEEEELFEVEKIIGKSKVKVSLFVPVI